MTDDPFYEPMNDAEDQQDAVRAGYLGYDDTHCEHGTFTGGWAGPDYICGYCEEGISQDQRVRWAIEAADRGERCAIARNGYHDGERYIPIHYVIHCTPVGPCPHWATTFGQGQTADMSQRTFSNHWQRMGRCSNVNVREETF